MEQNYLSRAAKYLADLRKRKAWRKVVSGMGAVVVFCTVYALILPALTWARPVTCGQEEHVHDESCYAPLPQESAGPAQMAAQTQAVPQCSVESIYEAAAPGQEHADFVLHTHGDECFLDGGVMICTLPTGFPLHVHDESCYTEQPVLVCGQEGAPEGTVPSPDPVVPAPEPVIHHHSDTCYTKTLICGQEEVPASEGHRHSDACYEITTETIPGEPICGITDDPAHIHGEECYGAPQTVEQRKLICLLPESDPTPGHQHTDACWEQALTCGKEEGQPEPIVDIMDEPVPAALSQETAGGEDTSAPPAPAVHVHSESCYQMQRVLTCDKEQYTEHLHVPACYDENGELTCGRLVTVSHVHTAECFPQPEQPGPVQPEEPERVLACGKEEHTHTDLCYAPEEPALPDNTQQKEQWDAIFWSNYVDGTSDVVLDAQVNGTWSDTAAMDPERLAQLYAAPAEDLSRYLSQEIGIQVDAQLYHSELHGPMDAEAGFSILLKWSHDETSFSTMTYTYQFPEQVAVADVERRILSDAAGPALAYSVAGNLLTVTYYAPAAAVETSFLLKAAWAPELGESTHIQWTPSTFTDVTFAKPELTVTKTMGEDGLRVMEDGTVWADYTVTVTNSGKVQAKEITFTDTLESQYFHFARGAFENGADYSLTVNTSAPEALSTEDGTPAAPGAEQFLTFENYDGGNVLTFPAFDLAAGESRVFQYKAGMSSEDRERVDEAIAAAKENAAVDAFAMPMSAEQPVAAGETVRNTATVTCPACGEGVEYSASSQGTYNGLESKHIEDYIYTYNAETFDVTFTVNGDALLPPGISAERVEELGRGNFLLHVNKLDESTEEYRAFAEKITAKTEGEENGEEQTDDSSEQLELAVLGLELRYNSMKLDLSDCEVMATVTPNEKLLSYKPEKSTPVADADGEETVEDPGYSVQLKAFNLEEQTDAMTGTTTPEVVEEGCITIDMSEETQETASTTFAPVVVTFNSLEGTNDPLSLNSAAGTANGMVESMSAPVAVGERAITFKMKSNTLGAESSSPKPIEYTVEFFGNIKLLELSPTGNYATDLSIIDTRKLSYQDGKETKYGRTPRNGEVKTDSTGAMAFLQLNADGTVKTTLDAGENIVPVQLFKGTSFKADPTKELNLGMFMILEQFAQSGKVELDTTGETNYTLNSAIIIKKEDVAEIATITANSELTDAQKESQIDTVLKGCKKIVLGGKSPSKIKFTVHENLANEQEDLYYLPEGATIRLICDPSSSTNYKAPVVFYDYDISDGQHVVDGSITSMYTQEKGINDPSNYATADGHKLAFGNLNTGTGLGDVRGNDGYFINKRNDDAATGKYPATVNFKKCSFGIVAGLNPDGTLRYAEGIVAPKLFNEGSAIGKKVYSEGYELVFDRVGDTYTMSSVRKNGTDVPSASNLNKLRDTGLSANSQSGKFNMFSNSFWPMDNVETHGAEGHDIKFGAGDKVNSRKFIGATSGNLPPVDAEPIVGTALGPNVDHNPYFGMQFNFEFTIPADYVGPLEYCFHGDDDLWLFLDNQLVCDIGGVHQSAGQYVDLRNYLPVDGDSTVGKHKLSLFYTERGASGSTCWMQFTLPGLRSIPVDFKPDDNKGNLSIRKNVEGAVDKNASFDFTLEFNSSESYTGEITRNVLIKNEDGTTTSGQTTEQIVINGKTDFSLKANEILVVRNVGGGTPYTIYEIPDSQNPNAFETQMTISENNGTPKPYNPGTDKWRVGGEIKSNTSIEVTYTNTFHYTLPETGGPGTTWYTYGVLPALVAAVVLYKRSRKKGGTVS